LRKKTLMKQHLVKNTPSRGKTAGEKKKRRIEDSHRVQRGGRRKKGHCVKYARPREQGSGVRDGEKKKEGN